MTENLDDIPDQAPTPAIQNQKSKSRIPYGPSGCAEVSMRSERMNGRNTWFDCDRA
jgi:hypothetical protein